jgi:alpha-1,3-mannosyltransferase
LRILHVVRQFYPAVGGLEDFVLSLAKQQRKEGLSPEVLTLNRLTRGTGESLSPRETVEGIPVRRIGYVGSPKYPIAPGVLGHLSDFDLIHVHAVDFFCDYLGMTRVLHKKPLVLSTHGGFFHTRYAQTLKKLFFSTVTRLTMTRYQCVVANSVNDLDLFRRITNKRLVMIENGVNTQKCAGSGSATFKPGFVYIGRFSSNKGLDKLVETFDVLAKQRPDARLHIVGNDFDNLLAPLQSKIAGLSNGEKIKVHVGLSDEDLRAVMKECSFFVSASEYEGFGQTVVEAMSAGLVPIVNRIPSFEKIIGATNVGRLTDFSKPSAAAADASELMSWTEQHHADARAAAIAASASYSWETTARRFTEVYESVMGSGREERDRDSGRQLARDADRDALARHSA